MVMEGDRTLASATFSTGLAEAARTRTAGIGPATRGGSGWSSGTRRRKSCGARRSRARACLRKKVEEGERIFALQTGGARSRARKSAPRQQWPSTCERKAIASYAGRSRRRAMASSLCLSHTFRGSVTRHDAPWHYELVAEALPPKIVSCGVWCDGHLLAAVPRRIEVACEV